MSGSWSPQKRVASEQFLVTGVPKLHKTGMSNIQLKVVMYCCDINHKTSVEFAAYTNVSVGFCGMN